ncbi:unnamed protein product, partial [Nippostrongylus brasiliensis]|uniref:GP-PDE domain-containing protein n=1 Tax=Nippostrongylus brasiliensis TaxID=27835 RepID=A0A0N4YM48_NIPBR
QIFSLFLFYWSGIYCRYNRCGESLVWPEKNRQYAQVSPAFSTNISTNAEDDRSLISLSWFVTNVFYTNTPCAITYNCMEMPSAVFCSLLAGISAVIEIHYSIDFNHLEWSEKWSWAAADSVALSAIHAVLAFALQ